MKALALTSTRLRRVDTDSAPNAALGERPSSRLRLVWQAALGPEGWWSLVGPSLFVLAGLSLLIYNHTQKQVTELAFWVGIALVVMVVAWIIEGNRRRVRAVIQYRTEARRDRLTGLPNRAQLDADLGTAIRFATEDLTLVLVDLQLHGSSSRLLAGPSPSTIAASAARLGASAERSGGSAYRVGDARFALLLPATEPAAAIVSSAVASVGPVEGPAVESCHSEVAVPEEGPDAELAMELAFERLESQHQRQPRSARRQAHAALLAVLETRRPELRDHLRSVAPQAVAAGRRLGLSRDQLDELVLAAGLQDIGLLTVSEEILAKTGELTGAEWDLVKRHPLAGERIVASAAGLRSVATLVRSSYERFDGTGYPDGLAGKAIPLGSRIIVACVAYAAMTEGRTYQAPRSPAEAVAELRRCAGTQFDPRVVEALAADLGHDVGTPRAPAPVGAAP